MPPVVAGFWLGVVSFPLKGGVISPVTAKQYGSGSWTCEKAPTRSRFRFHLSLEARIMRADKENSKIVFVPSFPSSAPKRGGKIYNFSAFQPLPHPARPSRTAHSFLSCGRDIAGQASPEFCLSVFFRLR